MQFLSIGTGFRLLAHEDVREKAKPSELAATPMPVR